MQHTRLVAYVEQKHVNKPKHKGQGKCGSTVGNLGLEKGKKKRIKRGKQDRNKDMTKMKCKNYGKLGHFSCECTKLKKVYPNPNTFVSYDCAHV